MNDDAAPPHPLEEENARLRAQVARAEANERAARRVLQTIVDALDPISIGWKDRESVFLGCNTATARTAGLPSPEAIVGKTDFDLPCTPEQARFFQSIDKQVMDADAPVRDLVEPLRHADGRATWVKTTKAPLHDDEGNVSGIVLTIEDITEQKRRELELTMERRLSAAVLNTKAFLVMLLDSRGNVLLFNQACEAASGRSFEEMKGKPFWVVLPEDEREAMSTLWGQIDPRIPPVTTERTWVAKDGTRRIISWSTARILYEDGQIESVLSTGIDVTERRSVEKEREALQAQVIDAQRAALRELSTPLIPIAEGVLVMPLIGAMDPQRAEQMTTALLEGVSAQRARTVILDVTGVQAVDASVTDALVTAAKAARLLGAQVMLTGIQPAVAEMLVTMGVDITGIEMRGSLQAGIAAALWRR